MRASIPAGRTLLLVLFLMFSVDSPSAWAADCNGNGIPDDQEPWEDCNGNGVPDECEIAIVASDPPDGAIDARLPHDPADPTILFGWSSVDLTFADGSGGGASPCALTAEDFSVDVAVGIAPAVLDVVVNGNVVTLALDGPIPSGGWTTITHDLSGTAVCLGFLPGDVNGDRWSVATDVLILSDHLGQSQGLQSWQADIDRDGTVGVDDLAALTTLLDDGWFYSSLPASSCDPTPSDCLQGDPPSVEGAGSRYLRITPDDGPYPVALLVGCAGGVSRYVGVPDGPHNIANVVEDPADAAWLTPADWGGSVFVTGTSVAAISTYDVRADFGIGGGLGLTPHGIGSTWEPYDVDQSGGTTTFLDVYAAVSVMQGDPSEPVYAADVGGSQIDACLPDGRVDMVDILALVKAFQQNPPCSGVCEIGSQNIVVNPVPASLELRASATTIHPEDTITIEVLLHNYQFPPRGYQTCIEVDGEGNPGSLDVVGADCNPENPNFFVDCPVIVAANPVTQVIGAIVLEPCFEVNPDPWSLGEFTLEASSDANGTYLVTAEYDPDGDNVILPMAMMMTFDVPVSESIEIQVVPRRGGGGPGPPGAPK